MHAQYNNNRRASHHHHHHHPTTSKQYAPIHPRDVHLGQYDELCITISNGDGAYQTRSWHVANGAYPWEKSSNRGTSVIMQNRPQSRGRGRSIYVLNGRGREMFGHRGDHFPDRFEDTRTVYTFQNRDPGGHRHPRGGKGHIDPAETVVQFTTPPKHHRGRYDRGQHLQQHHQKYAQQHHDYRSSPIHSPSSNEPIQHSNRHQHGPPSRSLPIRRHFHHQQYQPFTNMKPLAKKSHPNQLLPQKSATKASSVNWAKTPVPTDIRSHHQHRPDNKTSTTKATSVPGAKTEEELLSFFTGPPPSVTKAVKQKKATRPKPDVSCVQKFLPKEPCSKFDFLDDDDIPNGSTISQSQFRQRPAGYLEVLTTDEYIDDFTPDDLVKYKLAFTDDEDYLEPAHQLWQDSGLGSLPRVYTGSHAQLDVTRKQREKNLVLRCLTWPKLGPRNDYSTSSFSLNSTANDVDEEHLLGPSLGLTCSSSLPCLFHRPGAHETIRLVRSDSRIHQSFRNFAEMKSTQKNEQKRRMENRKPEEKLSLD